MKNLGDLKKLIEENGGVLRIGKLEFKNTGTDIDIMISDTLVMWIKKDQDGETNLGDLDTSIMDALFNNGDLKRRAIESEKQNRELEQENVRLKAEAISSQKAVGKVEAYENILLGREITVSK